MVCYILMLSTTPTTFMFNTYKIDYLTSRSSTFILYIHIFYVLLQLIFIIFSILNFFNVMVYWGQPRIKRYGLGWFVYFNKYLEIIALIINFILTRNLVEYELQPFATRPLGHLKRITIFQYAQQYTPSHRNSQKYAQSFPNLSIGPWTRTNPLRRRLTRTRYRHFSKTCDSNSWNQTKKNGLYM